MPLRAPREVAPGRGLQWVRDGLEIFVAAPLVWVGITLLFLLMGVVLAIIPFAGMLWGVAVPMLVGGLMLGCRAVRRGQPLEVRYLFNGFETPRWQPLALVGALYLAGSLIVMVPLLMLMIGGSLASAFALGSTGASGASLIGVGLFGLVMVLVAMAAGMALSMALWFAPALVVFDAIPALDALKLSLRAAWINVGAFVVYALVLLGVALVAAAPALAATFLIAARGERAGPFAVVLIGSTVIFTLLCAVLLLPAAWGAMYASYEDVFGE
jgi:hypothetical protein